MGLMLKAIIAVVGLLAASAVGAEDARKVPRSFSRFEFDTEVARGLWAEVATGFSTTEESGVSVDATTVAPRLVYGYDRFEGGVFILYHSIRGDISGSSGGGPGPIVSQSFDADGIGDLRLYGKAVPLRSEWADAGLGLEVSLPTGDDSDGLGAGEVGLLPYGSATAHLGPVDLGAHFGYRTFPGSDTSYWSSSNAFDSWVYGGGLFAPITDIIGVRAELLGESFDTNDSQSVVLFEPGVDIRLAAGAVDILLRPTAAAGFTDESPDWGIGGSVALAWDPMR